MRYLYILVLFFAAPLWATPWSVPRDTTASVEEFLKPVPPFYVPLGAHNIALKKPVTSSDDAPIIGELAMITDGEKPGGEGGWVEIGTGSQWAQIDLEQASRIYGVHIWNFNWTPRVYRDVIVQVCDEPTFTKNVRTLFNNDQDDTSKLGKGQDREFLTDGRGHIIDLRGKNYVGTVARYVRLYCRGSRSDSSTQYIEVEVIGRNSTEKTPEPRTDANLVKLGVLRPWTFTRLPAPASRNAAKANAAKTARPAPLPVNFLVPHDVRDGVWNISSSDTNFSKQNQDETHGSHPAWPYGPLAPGLQWVQVEFGVKRYIYAIQLWHNFDDARTYRDVIVQVADDSAFTQNVRTLFNNDADNSAKRGQGRDKEYVETSTGLVIDTRGKNLQGVAARCVRFYSRGSNKNAANFYSGIKIAHNQAPPFLPGPVPLILWKPTNPPMPYLNR